jgi:hypothetical protein
MPHFFVATYVQHLWFIPILWVIPRSAVAFAFVDYLAIISVEVSIWVSQMMGVWKWEKLGCYDVLMGLIHVN